MINNIPTNNNLNNYGTHYLHRVKVEISLILIIRKVFVLIKYHYNVKAYV